MRHSSQRLGYPCGMGSSLYQPVSVKELGEVSWHLTIGMGSVYRLYMTDVQTDNHYLVLVLLQTPARTVMPRLFLQRGPRLPEDHHLMDHHPCIMVVVPWAPRKTCVYFFRPLIQSQTRISGVKQLQSSCQWPSGPHLVGLAPINRDPHLRRQLHPTLMQVHAA